MDAVIRANPRGVQMPAGVPADVHGRPSDADVAGAILFEHRVLTLHGEPPVESGRAPR